ncbi:MAG: DNA gyrase inhibitor YacG [Steroidobacteraceae bacterium]
MSSPRVRCPTCNREIEWSDDWPFRPFCTERCKLIDLGAWLTEERAIAGDAEPAEPGDDAPPGAPPDGERT